MNADRLSNFVEESERAAFAKISDIDKLHYILYQCALLEKSYHQMNKTLEFAIKLRDELHSFRELFDENDPSSGKLIQEFDDFLSKMEMCTNPLLA